MCASFKMFNLLFKKSVQWRSFKTICNVFHIIIFLLVRFCWSCQNESKKCQRIQSTGKKLTLSRIIPIISPQNGRKRIENIDDIDSSEANSASNTREWNFLSQSLKSALSSTTTSLIIKPKNAEMNNVILPQAKNNVIFVPCFFLHYVQKQTYVYIHTLYQR